MMLLGNFKQNLRLNCCASEFVLKSICGQNCYTGHNRGLMISKMKINAILLILWLLNWAFADAQCPLNFDYVHQLPWDKSSCESAIIKSDCCQTVRALPGIGLAQYLRDESMFELPNNASAVSCLQLFQQQLDSLGLSPDLVAICLNRTSSFVSSQLLCAGIQTKEDWIRKLGTTPMDSACRGDLSDLDACYECQNARIHVHKALANLNRNLTEAISFKCYYFTLIYSAGVVNEFGRKSRTTAQCIFRLPFVHTTTHSRDVLAYVFIGTCTVLLVISVVGLLYCLCVEFIDPMAVLSRRFVMRNRNLLNSAMKPNTGSVVRY